VIYNNIDMIGQIFEVVLPNFESFKNGKQFLIMCIVVQLHHSKSAEVKGDQMNFIFFINNEKDCSKNMV